MSRSWFVPGDGNNEDGDEKEQEEQQQSGGEVEALLLPASLIPELLFVAGHFVLRGLENLLL